MDAQHTGFSPEETARIVGVMTVHRDIPVISVRHSLSALRVFLVTRQLIRATHRWAAGDGLPFAFVIEQPVAGRRLPFVSANRPL